MQEGQAAAARSDEDEFGGVFEACFGLEIDALHFPAVADFGEVGDAVGGGIAGVGLRAQPLNQFAGEDAVVDVGSGLHLSDGNRCVIAAGEQQRGPLFNLLPIFGVLHVLKKVVGLHALEARFEEVDLLLPVDEAEVGDGVDALAAIFENASARGVSPELLGVLKLLEDLEGFGHFDLAVGAVVGGVAQLANARVSSAGIVPAIRGFLAKRLGHLVELNFEGGVQLFEHGAQGGGHNAATDENDVWVFDGFGSFHGGQEDE